MKSKEQERLERKLNHHLYKLAKKAPLYVIAKDMCLNRLDMPKDQLQWVRPTFLIDIINLRDILGLSNDEIYQKLCTIAKSNKNRTNYEKMPVAVHRDNKNIHNTGGSSGRMRYHPKKVRVPSLRRGRNTWKKFYALYPKAEGKDIFFGSKLKKL